VPLQFRFVISAHYRRYLPRLRRYVPDYALPDYVPVLDLDPAHERYARFTRTTLRTTTDCCLPWITLLFTRRTVWLCGVAAVPRWITPPPAYTGSGALPVRCCWFVYAYALPVYRLNSCCALPTRLFYCLFVLVTQLLVAVAATRLRSFPVTFLRLILRVLPVTVTMRFVTTTRLHVVAAWL